MKAEFVTRAGTGSNFLVNELLRVSYFELGLVLGSVKIWFKPDWLLKLFEHYLSLVFPTVFRARLSQKLYEDFGPGSNRYWTY